MSIYCGLSVILFYLVAATFYRIGLRKRARFLTKLGFGLHAVYFLSFLVIYREKAATLLGQGPWVLFSLITVGIFLRRIRRAAGELHLFELSFKNSPLELREAFSISPKRIPEFLKTILKIPRLSEAAHLGTCHRQELYWVGPPWIGNKVKRAWAEFCGVDAKPLHPVVGPREGVFKHLFRVAASLDSLVIGENQILGQVRDAYRLAMEAGTCGPLLHSLFSQALSIGKKVRGQNGLGRRPHSIPSVAVSWLEAKLGSLTHRCGIVIGMGEIGTIAAKLLKKRGIGRLILLNRTVEVAARYAKKWAAFADRLENYSHYLHEADIIISCVDGSANRFSLSERVRGLIIVDLAVPRNWDANVGKIPGVKLVNVDDLKSMVPEVFTASEKEVALAEEIIAQQVEKIANSSKRFDTGFGGEATRRVLGWPA